MSDWLKRANELLGDLAGQAGRQAETVQLQAKLGSLDNDLDRVYIEASKRAEELLKARQIYDDELRVILERARVINEEMMELRQKVQDLRHTPDPAQPEAPEAPSAPRPPRPSATPEDAAGQRTCAQCGEKVATHVVSCPHCGTRQQT